MQLFLGKRFLTCWNCLGIFIFQFRQYNILVWFKCTSKVSVTQYLTYIIHLILNHQGIKTSTRRLSIQYLPRSRGMCVASIGTHIYLQVFKKNNFSERKRHFTSSVLNIQLFLFSHCEMILRSRRFSLYLNHNII